MEKIDDNRKQKVKNLLLLIEKVLKEKFLDEEHLKDEMEKHFSFICQGKDDINPYERRSLGITDKEWQKAISECRRALNLESKINEKLFG